MSCKDASRSEKKSRISAASGFTVSGDDVAGYTVENTNGFDLALGAKLAEGATLNEWKSHEAQTEVAVDELIPHIKRLLAR